MIDRREFESLKRSVCELRSEVKQLRKIVLENNAVHHTRIRFNGEEDDIEYIQKVACEIGGITLIQLLKKCRRDYVVIVRKAAMLLAYSSFDLGTTIEIGERFKRHHTTISADVKSARALLKRPGDTDFKKFYFKVKDRLNERFGSREISFQI